MKRYEILRIAALALVMMWGMGTNAITVSFSVNGEILSQTATTENGILSQTDIPNIELPKGVYIAGWSSSGNSTSLVNMSKSLGDTDITLYAVFTNQLYELVTDASTLSAGDKVVIAATGYDYAISTKQNTNNRGSVNVLKSGNYLFVNNEVAEFTLSKGDEIIDSNRDKRSDTWSLVCESMYLYAPDPENNYLKSTQNKETGSNWVISIDNNSTTICTYLRKGTTSGYVNRTIQYLKSNNIFSCYTINNQAVSLYSCKSSSFSTHYYNLIISSAKYATYYNTTAYIMPEGLKGYTISGEEETNKVSLVESYNPGDVVPAETALLISAESEGDYALLYTNEEGTRPVNNLLHGTSTETPLSGQGTYYQFSYNSESNNLGFYWQTADGASITNAANRCYLLIPTTSGIKAFTLSDLINSAEEETSIISPTLSSKESNAYSLTGLPVSPAYRGIVIKDGKKILRK